MAREAEDRYIEQLEDERDRWKGEVEVLRGHVQKAQDELRREASAHADTKRALEEEKSYSAALERDIMPYEAAMHVLRGNRMDCEKRDWERRRAKDLPTRAGERVVPDNPPLEMAQAQKAAMLVHGGRPMSIPHPAHPDELQPPFDPAAAIAKEKEKLAKERKKK